MDEKIGSLQTEVVSCFHAHLLPLSHRTLQAEDIRLRASAALLQNNINPQAACSLIWLKGGDGRNAGAGSIMRRCRGLVSMHEVLWALLPTGPKTAAALHHEVWQLQETAFSEMVSGMQPISLGLSNMLLVSIAQHVLCSKQGERSLRCMMCCGSIW